ncbi:hypothetical protein [Acidobacterium sp. S8]|uniref:hypothetical protein n=1 Tax=Acidobacterium sp. S8 TaxID=1641854 RepID=UPI00131BBC23|nr:hypothetical protein [Acidobacterium sp. S8]
MAKSSYLWAGILALSLTAAHAQNPHQIIQQVVDAERAANRDDHSHWIYLDDIRKPNEHILQWVAGTQQGDVRRVLERNEQKVDESHQRDSIDKFLHDTRAQSKDVSENAHDNQQVDDFLKLLPVAFVWTQTSVTPSNTTLHFEPEPNFHPPTRESRVFSSMAGDVVVDNQQHRIRSMSGRLIHDVTFGGGLLGRLKEGSSFSLEQAQVGEALWELTAVHVHLEGNALLFKSISLQQDDQRSRFEPESPTVTLGQAAAAVMKQPESVHTQNATLKVN